uniref:Uncharacterized protein n=1 Tax=Emiliania huxleyi (strain CCMP1516) TaxID=280463 RepID=A0A0D3KF69_EMIH1
MKKNLELHDALIAVIGDEDTVTGMLLAGVGNIDARKASNFVIIEEAFTRFTSRSDIAVLLINQYIATMIRRDLLDTSTPTTRRKTPSTGARRTKLLLGIRD